MKRIFVALVPFVVSASLYAEDAPGIPTKLRKFLPSGNMQVDADWQSELQKADERLSAVRTTLASPFDRTTSLAVFERQPSALNKLELAVGKQAATDFLRSQVDGKLVDGEDRQQEFLRSLRANNMEVTSKFLVDAQTALPMDIAKANPINRDELAFVGKVFKESLKTTVRTGWKATGKLLSKLKKSTERVVTKSVKGTPGRYADKKIDDTIESVENIFNNKDTLESDREQLLQHLATLLDDSEICAALRRPDPQALDNSLACFAIYADLKSVRAETFEAMLKAGNLHASALNEVANSVSGARAAGVTTRADLVKLSRQVDFVAGAMFATLNAKDRISMLEANALGWKDDVRNKLLERERVLSIADDVQHYAHDASRIAAILPHLGVDPKTAADVRKGFEVGSGLSQVAGRLLKTDITGAIADLADIMFGGTDPAEQRHRELMAEFGRVHQQLALLDAKLDDIKLDLRAISDKLDRLEGVVTHLRHDVLMNHQILSELVLRDHTLLVAYISELDSLPAWEQRVRYFNLEGVKSEFPKAMESLRARIKQRTSFLTKSQEMKAEFMKLNRGEELDAYESSWINYVTLYESLSEIPADIFVAPAETFEDATRKVRVANANAANAAAPRFKSDTFRDDLLHPGAVIEAVELIPSAVHYEMALHTSKGNDLLRAIGGVTGVQGELMTANQLVYWQQLPDRAERMLRAENLLKDAIELLETSLAQQTLMSGDVAIELAESAPEPLKNAHYGTCLEINSLYRNNRLRRALATKRSQWSPTVAELYLQFYQSPWEDELGALLPRTRFVRAASGWSAEMECADRVFPLPVRRMAEFPTVQEFLSGQLAFNEWVPRLVRCRGELLDCMADLEFNKSIPSKMNAALQLSVGNGFEPEVSK